MLKWLRGIDWRAIGASALILVAATLAIKAVGLDRAPYQQEYGESESNAAQSPIVDAAEQAIADYTKALAVFTALLFAVTLVLAGASIWQGRLTQKSITLASNEFLATHRPKVLILTVRITTRGATRRSPVSMPDDTIPARTVIRLVNGGDSVCRLTEWRATIYIQQPGEDFMPTYQRTFANSDPNDRVLIPGQFGALEFEQTPVDTVWNRVENQIARAFIVGEIAYEGNDGISRVTGFCREFHRDTRRYHPVKNSEFEFAY